MKKYFTHFLMLVVLFIVVWFWMRQGSYVDNSHKFLPLIIALISIYFAFKQFRLKVTIDKIQAFANYPETSRHVIRVGKLLDMASSGNIENQINRNNIEKDETLYESVLFILGFCDDIAGGIKLGIIDENMAKKLQGTFILRMSEGLIPYIKEVQDSRGEQSYINLMRLYRKWNKNN